MSPLYFRVFLPLIALAAVQGARAEEFSFGNYAVLYEGTGGHNLSITNVTINGNVGVGGTGVVQFSGPGTIAGELDFSAASTGQYHNTNGSNVGPTSVNYNDAAVTSALNSILMLSVDVTTNGTANISLTNAGLTLNESSGQLETVDGVVSRVFNVISYSAVNSTVLTINGDGSGDPVIFNFGSGTGNINLSGTVVLGGTGLTSADQVLWNFQSSGKNINLNNNGESAFIGDLLAPNDALGTTHATLNGRVLGGDSSDMQIVSGTTINVPSVPEGGMTLLMLGGVLAGIEALRRKLRA
jgi:hypothetical protein